MINCIVADRLILRDERKRKEEEKEKGKKEQTSHRR